MCGGAHDETKRRGELLGEAHVSHRQVCPVISTQAKPTPFLFGARRGGPATLGRRMSSLCRGLQPVLRSPSLEVEGPPEMAGLRLRWGATQQCCEQSGDVLPLFTRAQGHKGSLYLQAGSLSPSKDQFLAGLPPRRHHAKPLCLLLPLLSCWRPEALLWIDALPCSLGPLPGKSHPFLWSQWPSGDSEHFLQPLSLLRSRVSHLLGSPLPHPHIQPVPNHWSFHLQSVPWNYQSLPTSCVITLVDMTTTSHLELPHQLLRNWAHLSTSVPILCRPLRASRSSTGQPERFFKDANLITQGSTWNTSVTCCCPQNKVRNP